jgi:hypothetical protein
MVALTGEIFFRISPRLSNCSPFTRLSLVLVKLSREATAKRVKSGHSNKREGDTAVRFMVIVKASQDSEAGKMPTPELLAEMGKFNEELIQAGVMLAGEGLQSSAKGSRVKFVGDKRIVTDGPFAETKELIAGFWLWKCASKAEAIEWVKRCPNPMPGREAEIEIRQVFEPEDFVSA